MSADGRFVVSAGEDTTALVWDATRPRSRAAAGADAAARVRDLAGDDAEQAYASAWALVRAPKETVAFLDGQPGLFAATDGEQIRKWIRALDSDTYAERERAARQLAQVLAEAESYLKKALDDKPSAEARRRIEQLLERAGQGLSGKALQGYRLVEVLEQIVEPGAVGLLKKLAAGDPEARLTRAAAAAVGRVGKR
jgi:hypothetical protein